MDDRAVGTVHDRTHRVAQHRRMREDCVTTFATHPAWYPSAGTLPMPDGPPRLLDDLGSVERRWREAQARFVDDPCAALAAAQSVLEELTRALDRALHGEHEALARRWRATDDRATEDLRQVMRGYAALIERLLAI